MLSAGFNGPSFAPGRDHLPVDAGHGLMPDGGIGFPQLSFGDPVATVSHILPQRMVAHAHRCTDCRQHANLTVDGLTSCYGKELASLLARLESIRRMTS